MNLYNLVSNRNNSDETCIRLKEQKGFEFCFHLKATGHKGAPISLRYVPGPPPWPPALAAVTGGGIGAGAACILTSSLC